MFAEKMDPEIRPVPTAQEKELRELTVRRVQLIEMMTAEKNRLKRVDSEPVKLSVRLIITLLDEEKQRIEKRLQRWYRSMKFMQNSTSC
jgi:transposase